MKVATFISYIERGLYTEIKRYEIKLIVSGIVVRRDSGLFKDIASRRYTESVLKGIAIDQFAISACTQKKRKRTSHFYLFSFHITDRAYGLEGRQRP